MTHVFLSYSRDDRRIMEPLRDYLRARGIDVWTDEHLTPGTADWEAAIDLNIRESGAVVVLLSPSSNQDTSYVRNEIRYALTQEKTIYPVLVAGDSASSIPSSLIRHQYVDIRGRARQTPDEAYHRLATALSKQLGTPLRKPMSQNVTIEGDVLGNVDIAGQAIIGGDNIAGTQVVEATPSKPAADQPPPQRQLRAKPDTPRKLILWTGGVIGGVGLIVAIVLVVASLSDGNLRLTPKPTHTSTPEQTTDPAITLAEAGVASNVEWEPYAPYIEEFDGVNMALVPAGCFMMGSEDGDDDETPVYEQCFEEPFWIDVTEVTNAQYGSEGYFSGANRPRDTVNWFLAVEHCEDQGARLPTEAEWEYAARGPDGLVYPWGKGFVPTNVVYSSNSGSETAEVGSRPGGVSWVGAYDMSGNVWEWVSSVYLRYPYDATDGREVSGSTASSSPRVLRGGAWLNDYETFLLRAANRLRASPGSSNNLNGFRCARDY